MNIVKNIIFTDEWLLENAAQFCTKNYEIRYDLLLEIKLLIMFT